MVSGLTFYRTRWIPGDGCMQAFKERILEADGPFPAEIFLRDSARERIFAPLHWHDCLELLYMIDGSARQRINDRMETIHAGDLVILREGDLHATETDPESSVRILVVKFLPALLADAYSRMAESIHVRAFLSQSSPRLLHLGDKNPDAHALRVVLESLYREWNERRPAYELAVHGLLYSLIAGLRRIDSTSTRVMQLNEAEGRKLAMILDQAVRNLPEVMTLDKAAGKMNYSYSYFSRRFRQLTGHGFKAYMDFMRIREAERLALQEGLSLSQCALRTGFSDAACFSRTYRRLRGESARHLLGHPGCGELTPS